MPKTIVFLLAMALIPAAAMADETYWNISGYFKNYFTVFDMPMIYDDPLYGQAYNDIRLKADYHPSPQVSFEIAYSLTPKVNFSDRLYASLSQLLFFKRQYRVDDPGPLVYPDEYSQINNFMLYENLDRLYLGINTGFSDLYIGRQAIAWGSARTVNPTDVFVPYSYDELNVEDRLGVDAVRWRIPLGFMGEIDAGYLFGNDFEYEQSGMYLRTKHYLCRTDFSLMAVNFKENLMLGVDLARSIGGAGTWFEAAFVAPDAFNPDGRVSGDDDYVKLTVGADYSLTPELYGFLEYHFNGAGSDDNEFNLAGTAYSEGGTFLLGKHYINPGFTYQITPLIIFSGSAMYNLSDNSCLLIPNLEFNIAPNIYLAAGAYVGLGENDQFENYSGIYYWGLSSYKSEFGDFNDTYFTSFRVYF